VLLLLADVFLPLLRVLLHMPLPPAEADPEELPLPVLPLPVLPVPVLPVPVVHYLLAAFARPRRDKLTTS
jgi:hypothetical protein